MSEMHDTNTILTKRPIAMNTQVIEMNTPKMLAPMLQQAQQVESDLSEKVQETARWMMSVAGKNEFEERQAVYYPLLEQWRAAKAKLMALESQWCAANKPAETVRTAAAIAMEEKRAIKEANVTCSTYERAQRRLFKQAEGFVSGKK